MLYEETNKKLIETLNSRRNKCKEVKQQSKAVAKERDQLTLEMEAVNSIKDDKIRK